ncbi:homoserine kinase [Merismopedia glauca]|uniref:Homoserine kinase n=1 Tax=Merismopedia glauca CCAP 1448/3 TaxID=1296344 RepID=A0A2T1C339_9CYAN|nr:homoserine kinase [Merismopedia glauca]PSB02598.1 homoserine kinase [Merismopedia glauca CCAP 1448/3]
MSAIAITVPGTTANLGPGFDCLGAALTIYNRFGFSLSQTTTTIAVTGLEAARVGTDESNLVYQSFLKLYQHINRTPPAVNIEIELGVPLARGLGSSATAIAGGLVGANILAGSPLSMPEIVDLAIEIEGHPDNVVPAILGGCKLAATNMAGNWVICDLNWHSEVIPVVAIPNFELSTADARRVLPDSYARADAIFNTAHLGLLLRGLESGNQDWLSAALQDRIHQPYRQALIQGYTKVQTAAIEVGAYGMVISGAGPTLLALTDAQSADGVVTAMESAWKREGIEADVRSLHLDYTGLQFENRPLA